MFIVLLILVTSPPIQTANILGFFQCPFYSHVKFYESIVTVLLDEGHHVTAFTEKPLALHPNLTQILLNDTTEIRGNNDNLKLKKSLKAAFDSVFGYVRALEIYLRNQKVQQLIKDGKKNQFDLLITEQLNTGPAMC